LGQGTPRLGEMHSHCCSVPFNIPTPLGGDQFLRRTKTQTSESSQEAAGGLTQGRQ